MMTGVDLPERLVSQSPSDFGRLPCVEEAEIVGCASEKARFSQMG